MSSPPSEEKKKRPRPDSGPRIGVTDPLALFEEIKAYVGFTPHDSELLRSLYPSVRPHLEEIVEDFYARILRTPGARRAITEGEAQIARLKQSQREWLIGLLEGPHDAEFALKQARIGRIHVKVGLDQIYMVTGVQVFREHLTRAICSDHDRPAKECLNVLGAVNRVLSVVLSLMMETYRDDYLRKILETEKNATMRRLAALGEVAASLAHEIRNPLAGISGAIQVLSQDFDSKDSRQEIIHEILREIGRLNERVNDLLMYSRPSTPSREPTRPRELLDLTRRILAEDPMMDGVQLHIAASDGLPDFPLDPGLIQQVLVNLVLNSLQAMKGEGEIWLEAASPGGGSLQITVEDSGPGLRPEDIEKIFRPFYTTRSRGTGLGLSISRRLVEAHGGSLEAGRGSRCGGARFLLHLPLPSREATPEGG